MIPYFSPSTTNFGQVMWQREFETRDRLKQTLLASELNSYRRRHGRYPAELAQVQASDAGMQDEFTNTAFTYETAGGKDFLLCSPGANGNRIDARKSVLCLGSQPPAWVKAD